MNAKISEFGPGNRATPVPAEREDTTDEWTRRLQRMGAVTVGVSLPRQWTSPRGLTVGAPVELRTLPNGTILVRDPRTLSSRESASVTARSGEPREHLFRRLVAAYLGGASEFIVEEPGGLTLETRQVVREFARRTVQPELLSEEGTRLVLRDVSRGAELPVPLLLRRMYQVVVDLQDDARRSWEGTTTSAADSFETRDDEVDRHAWLIERILALRLRDAAGAFAVDDPLQVLLLVRSLERIADHAVGIAEHGRRLKEEAVPPAVLRALSDFHRHAVDTLRAAFLATQTPDADRANELLDSAQALHAQAATLNERFLFRAPAPGLSPLAITSVALVLQSIDRTVAYAQDIAQVGLDRAGRTPETPLTLAPLPKPASPTPVVQRSHSRSSARRAP